MLTHRMKDVLDPYSKRRISSLFLLSPCLFDSDAGPSLKELLGIATINVLGEIECSKDGLGVGAVGNIKY